MSSFGSPEGLWANFEKKERKDDCLGCVGAIKRAMGGSLVLENV